MGASTSSLTDLTNNTYLNNLACQKSISTNDPFWNQLLSFNIRIPLSDQEYGQLEETVTNLCKNFAINNCRSGNFYALIHVFLTRASELRESAESENELFIWQCYNALFIIRTMCKYFVENLSEEVIIQQFTSRSPSDLAENDSADNISIVDDLLSALFSLLVELPVLPFTYLLHVEAVNCILTMLAFQMFHEKPAQEIFFYRFIYAGKWPNTAASKVSSKKITAAINRRNSLRSHQSHAVVTALLQNYISQITYPVEFEHSYGQSSLFSTLAGPTLTYCLQVLHISVDTLWSALTLGFGKPWYRQRKSRHGDHGNGEPLLAEQSLLLLLVLVSHCSSSDCGLPNPYRKALFELDNTSAEEGTQSDSEATAISGDKCENKPTTSIDYLSLYDTLAATEYFDQDTLLVYLLLHRNTRFRTFILGRTDIQKLVLPLLRILYDADKSSSHHIYMALIVLLMLSEDDGYSTNVHNIPLGQVEWFQDRTLSDITLGGMIVLVVLRTIQFNITRIKDQYLHTNCLATIANMSPHFHGLHPYVAQRIVRLFTMLSKKYHKLEQKIRNVGHDAEPQLLEQREDLVDQFEIIGEVMRMILEIVNSSLYNALPHNPSLIYTLLYQRQVFEPFKAIDSYEPLIRNISTVLEFFTERLENSGKGKFMTVEEVNDVIATGINQFNEKSLQKFAELKFRYMEESSPEDFFLPYLWCIVFHNSGLGFNRNRIIYTF